MKLRRYLSYLPIIFLNIRKNDNEREGAGVTSCAKAVNNVVVAVRRLSLAGPNLDFAFVRGVGSSSAWLDAP